ncbi:unnamed protein product, partial [marine sediment metagenome]
MPELSLSEVATGVIDAASNPSVAEMVDLKLYEVTECLVLPNLTPGGNFSVFANLDSWNALPDDLKAILHVGMVEGAVYGDMVNSKKSAEGMVVLKAEGINVVTLPPEDVAKLRKMASGLWDDYA